MVFGMGVYATDCRLACTRCVHPEVITNELSCGWCVYMQVISLICLHNYVPRHSSSPHPLWFAFSDRQDSAVNKANGHANIVSDVDNVNRI